jgi:hypothetical protein
MFITLYSRTCLPNVCLYVQHTHAHTHIYTYLCAYVYVNIPRCYIDFLRYKVAIFTTPYFLTYLSLKNIRAIYYVTSQYFPWTLYLCYQIYGTENCRVLFWYELVFTYSFKENVPWQTTENDWWQELHLTIEGRNSAHAHTEMMMFEVTCRVKGDWLTSEINSENMRLSL